MNKHIHLLLVATFTLLVSVTGSAFAGEHKVIELPEVDPLSITGDIITAGSSTVFPLTTAMAERFEEEGYTGVITVDSIGSGAGFERFCASAETDISNASRPIKDSEIEECEANGRTPIEFRIGTDALAISVSIENDYVDNLTIEQLGMIFSGEVTSWNQINSDWPADPITIFSPGTDSGTFDYFVEEVLEPFAEAQGIEDDLIGDAAREYILSVEGTQFSENDNVLVEGIAGSSGAIGYFGFAYYLENTDVIRVVSIDGVDANGETAEDGSYPLARPLFIYSDATIMTENSPVADFINFYLSNVDDIIIEVGYFPASVEALNQSKENWLVAMGLSETIED
ncbi:MAG: PstS family phosphate ABC transporter substrate-binding protein [Anaerolineae bacterium]|nr:PstS family phosphate ABC transporter substrate-binding protein [Anaerolineae bacterium]MDQ7034914.1 PstS family phosphate ABC transporter substrate-binding protein [Anaerolineae bacterium]